MENGWEMKDALKQCTIFKSFARCFCVFIWWFCINRVHSALWTTALLVVCILQQMKVLPTPLPFEIFISLFCLVCLSFRFYFSSPFWKMFIIKIVYLGHVLIRRNVHINTLNGFYVLFWILFDNSMMTTLAKLFGNSLDLDARDLQFSFHFTFNGWLYGIFICCECLYV